MTTASRSWRGGAGWLSAYFAHGSAGSIRILFMTRDGDIKSSVEMSNATPNGLPFVLPDAGHFGSSFAGLGDIDGDGVEDIAVGAQGGVDDQIFDFVSGRVYILRMNADGTVKAASFIEDRDVGLPVLDLEFGASVAGLGDIDGDGVGDVAVGAPFGGGVTIILLEPDGSMKSWHRETLPSGGVSGRYGQSLARVDPGSCGVIGNLAVGRTGLEPDAVYVLSYNPGTWTTLGAGMAGADGVPSLTGDGHLFGGAPATLRIRRGRPGAAVLLAVGRTRLDAQFKDGVLVPAPDSFFSDTLGPHGARHWEIRWPTCLPSGSVHYWQAWIQDPAAPSGWAVSNALESRTP